MIGGIKRKEGDNMEAVWRFLKNFMGNFILWAAIFSIIIGVGESIWYHHGRMQEEATGIHRDQEQKEEACK